MAATARASSQTTSAKGESDGAFGKELKQDKVTEKPEDVRRSPHENEEVFEKSVSTLSGFAMPLGTSRW